MTPNLPNPAQPTAPDRSPRPQPTVTAAFDDGTLVELLYAPGERRTAFAVWQDGAWRECRALTAPTGERLVPYSPHNNLIRNRVVLLPAAPAEYGAEAELLEAIGRYIRAYVDAPPAFERVAAAYVLLTWVYDGFNELPYLRLRGDYGTGKTRALHVIGSICNRPIFASGAATISPIFHLLDRFRGTLLIDEADFRYSDETAELTKLLNTGNQSGAVLLRTEVSPTNEFNPRAFQVYGPKLLAMRGFYTDRALESRCITLDMDRHGLTRRDVPINLPARQRDEAAALRDRLLLFRFRNLGRKPIDERLIDPALEPRLNQIFVPLMSAVASGAARADLAGIARQANEALRTERSLDVEAQVLQVVRELFADGSVRAISMKAIAEAFAARHGHDERRITGRWVGAVVRRRLGLRTVKREGVFVIPATEADLLARLYAKYGVAPPADGSGPPPDAPSEAASTATEPTPGSGR